jgi:hypothetical protein
VEVLVKSTTNAPELSTHPLPRIVLWLERKRMTHPLSTFQKQLIQNSRNREQAEGEGETRREAVSGEKKASAL